MNVESNAIDPSLIKPPSIDEDEIYPQQIPNKRRKLIKDQFFFEVPTEAEPTDPDFLNFEISFSKDFDFGLETKGDHSSQQLTDPLSSSEDADTILSDDDIFEDYTEEENLTPTIYVSEKEKSSTSQIQTKKAILTISSIIIAVSLGIFKFNETRSKTNRIIETSKSNIPTTDSPYSLWSTMPSPSPFDFPSHNLASPRYDPLMVWDVVPQGNITIGSSKYYIVSIIDF